MSWAYGAPCCTRAPTVVVGRRILERPVLNELCVKSAVGRIVDVLEENTDKLVTYLLASRRGFHLLLG